MRLFKELKLVHWPKPKKILIEYLAVLICVAIFSSLTMGIGWLTFFILNLL